MLHQAKAWHNETMGRKVVEALRKNNFDAVYVPDAAQARDAIAALIPEGATIGFGGSVSLASIGIFDTLKQGAYQPINPPWTEAGISLEERTARRKLAMTADVFLAGTNALTVDGKLVNTDATGNRVTGMIFGPKKTIVVAGINKLVRSLDEALERVSQVAAPPNCKRMGLETPCAITGECSDCRSPQRICCATVILHRKPRALDFIVVLVGEELGF